jgi:hypothetical protein
MSEQVAIFQAMNDHKKDLRAKFGMNCPQCALKRPRAHPSILLPQQRCRVDGYVDPRPELTNEEWSSV